MSYHFVEVEKEGLPDKPDYYIYDGGKLMDELLEWARERDDGGPVNWVDSLDLTIWAGHHTIIEAEEEIK